jgi:hypothetical protein
MSSLIRVVLEISKMGTVHMNPELVFRRELVLANCREDVTVEKVLSFPIGPIPT